MSEKKNKFGTAKNIRDKKKKKTFMEWADENQSYLIIGAVVILAVIIYAISFSNLDRGAEQIQQNIDATPSPEATEQEETGTLVVTSNPDEAVIQFRGEAERAPHTFKDIPEGEYIIIGKLPQYSPVEKNITITTGKTVKVQFDFEEEESTTEDE